MLMLIPAQKFSSDKQKQTSANLMASNISHMLPFNGPHIWFIATSRYILYMLYVLYIFSILFSLKFVYSCYYYCYLIIFDIANQLMLMVILVNLLSNLFMSLHRRPVQERNSLMLN